MEAGGEYGQRKDRMKWYLKKVGGRQSQKEE